MCPSLLYCAYLICTFTEIITIIINHVRTYNSAYTQHTHSVHIHAQCTVYYTTYTQCTHTYTVYCIYSIHIVYTYVHSIHTAYSQCTNSILTAYSQHTYTQHTHITQKYVENLHQFVGAYLREGTKSPC